MKKTLLMIFISAFFLSMSQPAFSFDLTGWWSRDNNIPNTPELLKITKERFSGIKYSILSSSADETKISIDNGGPTIIKSLGNDKISITTVNNNIIIYKFITNDTTLSEAEVEKLTK